MGRNDVRRAAVEKGEDGMSDDVSAYEIACAYCGKRFPIKNAARPNQIFATPELTAHIYGCALHPMGELVKENNRLRARVAELERAAKDGE